MATTQSAPLVTIGLLAHNAERTIRATLDSIRAQSMSDFEVVISDDASSDRTADICREYERLDDRVTLVQQQSNIGGTKNFNAVLPMVRAPYFVWVSDHDIWEPDFLASCVAELEAHPSAALCHTRVRVISSESEDKGLLPSALDTRGLRQQARMNVTMWSLSRSTVAIYGVHRTSSLRRSPAFPELYRPVIAPDVVLLTELALLGEFLFLDRELFKLREDQNVDDIAVYLRKLRLCPFSGTQGLILYYRMIRELLRVIRLHVPGLARRMSARASVFLYLGVERRLLLINLFRAGRRARRSPGGR